MDDYTILLSLFSILPLKFVLTDQIPPFKIELTASSKYIVAYQPLTMNCTAKQSPTSPSATFIVDGNVDSNYQVAVLKDGKCYMTHVSNKTLCNDDCSCDSERRSFLWIYNGTMANYTRKIECQMTNGSESPKESLNFLKGVPVTSVTLTPAFTNNIIYLLNEETQIFTCTTDSIRPAAWIQWCIGGKNISYLAQTQPRLDGDIVQSSSRLNFTGIDTDHEKHIYCNAVNFEGRPKVESNNISIYIVVPVTEVSIIPAPDSRVIDIIEGDTQNFTCTTDSSRPDAWIHWYIGERNLSHLAQTSVTPHEGDKSISSSLLVYTGTDEDHKRSIYCISTNIDGNTKVVKSTELSITIQIPVSTVTIIHAGGSNIEVEEGQTQNVTCTTSASRPVSLIQWYIGNKNVTHLAQPHTPLQDEDKLISSSTLVYTGNDSDHNKTIYCEAYNIYGRDKINTTKKSIYILTGPKKVSLDPINDIYTVNESKGISKIKCLATCRPDCNYTWTGPTGFTKYQSYLQFVSINRNQSGIYVCTANNDYGKNTSKNIVITVHYPPDVSVDHTFTDEDESEVSFVCNASGIPSTYAYSGWTQTFDGHVIRNSSALSYFTHDDKKMLSLSRLFHQDAGNYRCYVDNGVPDRNDQVMQFGQEQLYVKGSPVLLTDLPPDDTFSTKRGGNITVVLRFFTFPDKIEAYWYNTSSESSIEDNINNGITTSIQKTYIETKFYETTVTVSNYAYEAVLEVSDLTEQIEGTYILIVRNGFKDRNISVNVVISSKPDDPSELNVTDILSTELTVLWNRGYSGGHSQVFNVSVLDSKGKRVTKLINDSYAVQKQECIITDLSPSTEYSIRLFAENKIGKSNLIEMSTTIETKAAASQIGEQSSQVGPVVGGIVAAAIAISTIIFIVYLKRRWSLNRKDQDSNGRKRLTHRNKTDEDEDGLKDNALYESAGQDYVPKQGPSGVEYAVVTKNKEKFQLNGNKNIQETVLHTDVKKAGNDEKANCKAKKGNNKQRKKDYRADNATNFPEKQNINKEGLVYADLDLNPSPNGPKFIHGIDDRTIYAMVDTTQKIDPLPDSDEENEDEKSI